ncbi:MAG: Transcriptional regulatory protein AfsQ1 [Chloroflexi bacterium ADurb.Bin325]|nr:MAG: Transcriptional regulatory protein AfsQ1 [Chloroflexi bacterium ADurb.Bin325]
MPREPESERPVQPSGPMGRDAKTWLKLIRQALEHLYDFPVLERHPLAQLPGPDPEHSVRLGGQGLRRMLLATVEALSPAPGTPVHAIDARIFNVLHLHYIEGLTIEETARELGLSVRQIYRELRAGEELVAGGLSERLNRDDPQRITRLAEHPRSMELLVMVERSQKIVEGLAAQRGIQVVLGARDDEVTVRCDPLLAHQALVSVLTAALQRASSGVLEVTLGSAAERSTLTVTYDPLPERPQPAALGSAAAGLIDQLGWQIAWTEMSDGREVLSLDLPACRSVLLVIDDDEGLAQLLDRYLTGFNLHVVAAGSGPVGLTLTHELAPAAVVLDVMMPDVDGWEVLQTLRTQPETSAIPVIICSVFNDPELASALGASYFLPKPVSREALLEALRAVDLL